MSSSDIISYCSSRTHHGASHHRQDEATDTSTAVAFDKGRTRQQEQKNPAYIIEEIDAKRHGNPSIASGSFGDVSIALCRHVGCDDWDYAAVKKIHHAILVNNTDDALSLESSKLTREAFKELSTLRALSGDHPCIVPLLAAYPSKARDLCLAFPYCLTDLETAIELRRCLVIGPNTMIPDAIVKAVFRDLLSALAHCHDKGIVHGDVNPANIMISARGRAQLADFGLAVSCSERRLPLHALCTISYRAPEVMLGDFKPHYSLDVWAAGLVLCELLTLRTMFMGKSDVCQLEHIFHVLGTPSETRWPDAMMLAEFDKIRNLERREPRDWATVIPRAGACSELKQVLQATVALDPASRCSVVECMKMPWFSSIPYPSSPLQVLDTLVLPELRIQPPCRTRDGRIDLVEAKQRATAIAAFRREEAQEAFSDDVGEWWFAPTVLRTE